MKTLINYLRSCFCKHEFEYIDGVSIKERHASIPHTIRYTYMCKKCGYVKNKDTANTN